MGMFSQVLAACGLARVEPPHESRVDPTIPPDLSAPGPVPASQQFSTVDPGMRAAAVDELLDAHRPLIGKIKLCYGADRPTFDKDILCLIRNYAAFVNVLPATADNYFAEPGGLFRLGLEAAFFSLQGTDAHIVSGKSTISARRQLEPRWRHATFIAGLCAELHRTLSHLTVTDSDGVEWPPYLGPLTQWLDTQESKQFFIRWIANAQESRTMGLFALQHITPKELLQNLAAGNNTVVPHLFASISGMPILRDHNVLDDLVRRACALVIDRDLVTSAARYGKPILGAHLERYLIDAMRRLVATSPAWSINQDKSRVWYSADGLFVVWPNAAADMQKLFDEDQFPGIPRSSETIVEILLAAGVLSATGEGKAQWSIQPPQAKATLEAVKLSSPAILLATLSDPPAPLDRSIIAKPANTVATIAASPTQPSQAPSVQPQQSPPPTNPPLDKETADGQLALELTAPDVISKSAADSKRPASGGPDLHQHPDHGAPTGSRPAAFELDAPMRLLPAVRDALAEVVATLNGDGKQARACTVPTGLFVPLSEFDLRKIDTGLAVRTLSELGMLAGAGRGPKTAEHDFAGKNSVGVVLDVKHIRGLNAEDFATSP